LWLNISNEYLPWYCPNPTPPNGMLSRPYCKQNVCRRKFRDGVHLLQ
jgi:hypothetical protein